jgi:serine phosphatase RsbU (regulator of sigma subunit)
VVKPACDAVMADIRAFVGGAEQSDDITMLCIRYIGSE